MFNLNISRRVFQVAKMGDLNGITQPSLTEAIIIKLSNVTPWKTDQ